MQIYEVKEKQIKEMRRHISYTGPALHEGRAGFFFDDKKAAPEYKRPLPEIEAFLNTRQKRAWEKLPQVKKDRIFQKMQASGDYIRYETLSADEQAYEKEAQLKEEGAYRYEENSSRYGGTRKEKLFLSQNTGTVRSDARQGAVPQVGERQRPDAAGALPPSETHAGISRIREAGSTPLFSETNHAATVPAQAARSIAEGAATGGVSEAVRFGTRAVKNAAKAFGRSVSSKETAQKEAAAKGALVRSSMIGGDLPSSSYAGGATRILSGAIAAAAAAGVMVIHVMLLPVLTIVLITMTLLTTLFSTISALFTIAGAGGDASYLSWAVSIAEDDSHGYSQAARMGPDYDCSSFVWYALTEAGYELGSYPFATGSMPEILTAAGFEQLPYTGMEDLMPGDILWVHGDAAQHTEMYMGEGQLVGASCDLDGGLPGDKSGTGGEIRVGGFYDDGWMGVFRSTAYGLGDIAIPQIYEGYDVGTIYTCTPHYGTWNWVYNQGRVHAAWIQAGSVYSENVAMIDDKYLIACTETFGRVGDWVTFYFEDGEAIECIIADAKSEGDPNWTPWGHIHGNQIDVIEAETNLTINPGTPGCMESWGGRRVVSATNHGAFV